MPPTSSTARGRQPVSKPLASSANVTSSTASTRAKASASTKASELRTGKSTSGTLKADTRQNIRPGKAPVPKASERTNKSTSTRSDTVSSSTEATPAPNSRTSRPESMPSPKEITDAPTEPKLKAKSTDPLQEEAADPSKSTTNSGSPPHKPQNVDKPKLTAPAPTSDPLQVAAQLYPWLYMTSTLDACFKSAEQTAKAHLETRARQLAELESELADQKARFHAERAADLFDALSTEVFAETAPKIMQAFLVHGEACERVEAEALQLALNPARTQTDEDEEDEDWDAPLRIYAKMLDTLDQLHAEALELEASVVKLTTSLGPPSDGGVSEDVIHDKPPEAIADAESGAQTQLLGVFKACLPVLRARIANLVMAQELIDGARENMSISLRMESLGLLD